MKRPYFNEEIRWNIRHETTVGAFKRLGIEILRLQREIDRELQPIVDFMVRYLIRREVDNE